MDIQQLATVFSSTFDPNLRQDAEKRLEEVRFPQKTTIKIQACIDHTDFNLEWKLYKLSTFSLLFATVEPFDNVVCCYYCVVTEMRGWYEFLKSFFGYFCHAEKFRHIVLTCAFCTHMLAK